MGIPGEHSKLGEFPNIILFPKEVPGEQKRGIFGKFLDIWKIGEFPAKLWEPVPRKYATKVVTLVCKGTAG